MSWFGSLWGDVSGAFSTVYKAVVGAGETAVTDGEQVGGQLAKDTSGFTTSLFVNWFIQLIIHPVVKAIGWIMVEIVLELMKVIGSILGAIFALPDGLAIWFQYHIEGFGIASPIAMSIAIGIILVVSIGIGLLILKGIRYIAEEA